MEDGQQRAIKQHRYVMEAKLGRKLSANEVVHHKNGNKTDNRPENLELMKFGEHSTHHNRAREYKKGYKMNLSSAERAARSERMRQQRAKQTASPKARG